MNPTEANNWIYVVLDHLFEALAGSDELVGALVFKGARVLSLRLGGGRQSRDIDSNFLPTFVEEHIDRNQQREFLERELTRAIRRHFERQDPVRYELVQVRVQNHPAKGKHPLGWDAFQIRISVNDASRDVRGLPVIEIDVAAPEELLGSSISPLRVGSREVSAYTLERIAGEKLRAFLTTLPAYRTKFKKPGNAVRVKDLYDLARILRFYPIEAEVFWQKVAKEFEVACRSRYVDCEGIATFQEAWSVTEKSYASGMIPSDIPFQEAAAALDAIVEFIGRQGTLPFSFPVTFQER